MQLNGKKSIRNALAVAACTLLSQSPLPVSAEEPSWKADLSTLYYAEKDRVTVSESIFSLWREIGENEALALKIAYDAISGASPNGAIFGADSAGVQTVTAPSGAAGAPVGAIRVAPLTQFTDTRLGGQLTFEKPLQRTLTARIEGSLSFEHDYRSYGTGALLSWGLNQRLTTLAGGLAFNYDAIEPETGTPVGLSSISGLQRLGKVDKRVIDLFFGVSQVLNRRTVMQINVTRGTADGYLTDPYKIITITDAAGEPADYLYEQRPGSRNRNILLLSLAHQLTENVVYFAYRHGRDDWGIRSHTADLKYRFELGRGRYLQPHLRYYTQSASDFYRHSLAQGAPLPAFASADYRLGNLVTRTAGLKVGVPTGKKTEFNVRAEYMQQTDADHRFPKVDVILVQATFSYSDIVDYALWSRPPP